ncbi:MAG: DUF5715 family protein [Leptospirales bacterium]
MKNIIFKTALVILSLCVGGFSVYWFTSVHQKKTIGQMEEYLKYAASIETSIVTKLATYNDLTKTLSPLKLRKYLLKDHLAIAAKMKLKPIAKEEQIPASVEKKQLVFVENNPENLFYFYNVKKDLRYLHPDAAKILQLIGLRFQENIRNKVLIDSKVKIKFAVSSALRPNDYQKALRSKNANAVLVSSHAFGISFDIFYEDYYLSIPIAADTQIPESLSGKMQSRIGYWLGDALRRQLHAILFETLVQLQDEKILYAIWEKKQRCYHITPAQL